MDEAFRNGGWGMYPTLIFGLMTFAASFRYALQPERRCVPLQITFGLMTLTAGVLGFVTGLIKTLTAVPLHRALGADRGELPWVLLTGLGESLNNVGLALVALIVALIPASIGAWRLCHVPPARG